MNFLSYLSLLLIFSSPAHSFVLEPLKITIPKDLYQIKIKDKNSKSANVKYKINAFHNTQREFIKAVKTKNQTPSQLISTLIYAYQNNEIETFLNLLSKESKETINYNDESFKDYFNSLGKIKMPFVRYAYEHHDGVLIAWSGIGVKSDRIVYVKKSDKAFRIHQLNIKNDDDKFWNVSLYFRYAPFFTYQPNKVIKRKIRSGLMISASVREFRNYLYLYNQEKEGTVQYIKISDNFPNNILYKDLDLNQASIRFKIKNNELKRFPKKAYLIESNFPLGKISAETHKKAKLIELK